MATPIDPLKACAAWWEFRAPRPGEPDTAYRADLAAQVRNRDPIEAAKILAWGEPALQAAFAAGDPELWRLANDAVARVLWEFALEMNRPTSTIRRRRCFNTRPR